MRDLLVLLVYFLVMVARLTTPGGTAGYSRRIVLLRHQLLILNRGRKRAPNLCARDRLIAGFCTFFIRRVRLLRSAMRFITTPRDIVRRSSCGARTAIRRKNLPAAARCKAISHARSVTPAASERPVNANEVHHARRLHRVRQRSNRRLVWCRHPAPAWVA